ncbi:MAG: hypothetical protein Q9M14_00015 [Mariprofundaceae bacterium]|nr:hypothetical protein [Mariprofundaceae bacterium]
MEKTKIKTLEDISRFLLGVSGAPIALHGSKEDVYKWIGKYCKRR